MTKRLIVCCDGTWNRPDQLDRGMAAPTNVAKFALAIARHDEAGTEQHLHYHQGVGTRRGERLRGGAFGVGLSRNVQECYRFLVENYEPGDEIYFLGFSRGAFTARSTAGLVRNSGILRSQHVGRIKEAYGLYRARRETAHPRGIEAQIFRRMYSHEELEIRFIGVWDTVGSLGIPLDGCGFGRIANRIWGFHDTELSSRVRSAYQALAIDEERGPFRPTLWKLDDAPTDQTLEQSWFTGAHCDVGGGYREPELAEITLLWMVDRARECGLAFEPDRLQICERGLELEAERRIDGACVSPDALGQIHHSRKGFYRLLRRHRRPIGEADGSRQSVASSAMRRVDEALDYRPPALEGYNGRITPVRDGSERPKAA